LFPLSWPSTGTTLTLSVLDDARTEPAGHGGWIAAELHDSATVWFSDHDNCLPGSNDGAYSCSAGTCTDVNAYTQVTAASTAAGTVTLTVASGAGFADGDDVLIWQTQSAAAPTTRAGRYQINTVRSGGGTTTLTLEDPLEFTVTSGTFNAAASEAAQIVRLPRYTSFSVSSGATVEPAQWDGIVGGLLSFKMLAGGSGSVSVCLAFTEKNLGFFSTKEKHFFC
jgi:hypothetical protein